MGLGFSGSFLEPKAYFCPVSLEIVPRFIDSGIAPLTVELIRKTNRKTLPQETQRFGDPWRGMENACTFPKEEREHRN